MSDAGKGLWIIINLALLDLRRQLSTPRMMIIMPLLLLFISGSCWGLSDPDVVLPQQIAVDTPYTALYLASVAVLLTATLAVVMLGFDKISRKRLTGELDIELSQPIRRHTLALAELLGLWMSAFIPTAIAALIGVGLIKMQMGAWPQASGLLLFLGATGLLLLWYSGLQLLASSLTRELGSSVTLGIATWLFFTMIWLLVTTVLAAMLGVDVTDLTNQTYQHFSQQVDLFSPNGVYQLLLQTGLPDADDRPFVSTSLVWFAALLWSIIPSALFIARFNRIQP